MTGVPDSTRRRHLGLTSPVPRVLVIGLDGATYDVLMPLAEAGVMPNLAALLRESALHQLNSTEPYTTPVAWTSFLTGCDVAEHGIFDYRYLDHTRGELLLNHSGRIPCPTLLHEVAAAGGSVVSLSLPMTFPAPAGVPGLIVGGLDSPSGAAALGPYPQFARRLRMAGARYSVQTIWKRKPQSFAELTAGVARTIADFDDHVTAARIADELIDWQLMIVQFQTLDSLQHRCWHLLECHSERSEESRRCEPRRTPRETLRSAQGDRRDPCDRDDQRGAATSWVREAQRAMQVLDHCLGQLIELADRRGAAIVALGDHGFGPFREKICVNEVLRQRGLQRSASLADTWRHRTARTAWKVHKWLHRRRHAGSTAAIRRPLEALALLDWRRTAAFAVHGELSALVYLNEVERFGRGAIGTARQREQAESETLAAFREARHPITSETLFEHVYATRQRFDCDPIARGWPDVVAIPAPGFHTRSKFGGRAGTGPLLRSDPTLTGTHRREAALLIRAPQAAAAALGTRPAVEMRDMAPTILGLLGLPRGQSMTGRCLIHPPARETPGGPASDHQSGTLGEIEVQHGRVRSPHVQRDPKLTAPNLTDPEQQIVEGRLRDLGYLE